MNGDADCEVRLSTPDARFEAVRRRVAEQVAALHPETEADATAWVDAVSEFDGASAR